MNFIELLSSLLFIIALVDLSESGPHHKHGHNHRRDRDIKHLSVMQLRTCASKLDFLCLGRLFTIAEDYKASVNTSISNLQDRIDDRIFQFETDRDALEIRWQRLVLDNFSALLQRTAERAITRNAGQDFGNCLLNLVYNFSIAFEPLLLSIDPCISENTLDISESEAAIASINSTAIAADADKVCDCVQNITTCSSLEQKIKAKACAKATAESLNIITFENSINNIYNRVDSRAKAVLTSLQSCFTYEKNIEPVRTILMDKINNECVP